MIYIHIVMNSRIKLTNGKFKTLKHGKKMFNGDNLQGYRMAFSWGL